MHNFLHFISCRTAFLSRVFRVFLIHSFPFSISSSIPKLISNWLALSTGSLCAMENPRSIWRALSMPKILLEQSLAKPCLVLFMFISQSLIQTLRGPVRDPRELPKWNYDGSSTCQAPGEDSEVILYPQAIFKDPFRRGNNILVMCDSYTPDSKPIATNHRAKAAKIFSHPDVVKEETWFGIEQEYTLLQKDVKWPLGWPIGGFPGPQGPYYCSIGANKAFGRDIVDAHYKACLYAGINISGINAEVMPGQWEFQIGPSLGISVADELWVARYILERITEIAGVLLSFDPKPIEGDWNGAGAHTNFSTKSMREEGGYEIIKKAIEKLKKRHDVHIAAYGEGNERRLTEKHETAYIKTFKWGVADRGTSIRVGRDTERDGKGYFEDRRPASNMDPYMVTSMIAETTILLP